MRERQCKVCGKGFIPYDNSQWGCSPICRTLLVTVIAHQKAEKERKRAEKANADKPLRMPSYRGDRAMERKVEWVLALPFEKRWKYSKKFTEAERLYAQSIEKRRMAEERRLSGFFVKGKVDLDMDGREMEKEESTDTIDNAGTEDEADA